MNDLLKNYTTAIVPSITSDQKEALQDFLCQYWKIPRVESICVEHPDLLLAYGVSSEPAHRLVSRVVNSLSWQDEKNLTVVSCHSQSVLSEGEQNRLLSKAVAQLEQKLPQAKIRGVILDGCSPRVIG